MSYDRILVLRKAGDARPALPGNASILESDEPPTPSELSPRGWEYVHPGRDCRILDGRVYTIAAEYIDAERPDMVVLSSPRKRFMTGVYTEAKQIYEILCHLARMDALFPLGNKLFSRAIFEKTMIGAPTTPVQAFIALEKLAVLSHPWIEFESCQGPDDEEYFRLVDHYTRQ